MPVYALLYIYKNSFIAAQRVLEIQSLCPYYIQKRLLYLPNPGIAAPCDLLICPVSLSLSSVNLQESFTYVDEMIIDTQVTLCPSLP